MNVTYGLVVLFGAVALGMSAGCSSGAEQPIRADDDVAIDRAADLQFDPGRAPDQDRFSYARCRDLRRGDPDFDECVRRHRNLFPIR